MWLSNSGGTIICIKLDEFRDMMRAGLPLFSVFQDLGRAEEHKGAFVNTVARFTDKIGNADQPERFGDGSRTCGFTHVGDVVRTCTLAAGNELEESSRINCIACNTSETGRTDTEYVRGQLPHPKRLRRFEGGACP